LAHDWGRLDLPLDDSRGCRNELADLERDVIAQVYLGLQRYGEFLLRLSTLRGQGFILHMNGVEIQHLKWHVRLDLLFQHRDRMTYNEIRGLVRGGELNVNSLGQLAPKLVFDLLWSSCETIRRTPLEVWEGELVHVPAAMRA